MERLNRGVVAVRSSATDVLVSWRLLGLDPAGTGFHVYRVGDGGAPARVTDQPLTAGTNFLDTTADLTVANRYFVREVLQGVEGKAVVRFRVLPSGKPHSLRVISESLAGFDFGAECVKTLQQAPPWLPPLDAKGLPVETEITFNCSFEVAD